MIALCRAGDEVILPTPWYFNHEMVLRQLGISLVPLPCRPPSFLPSIELARSLVTDRTRAIVLVTPNNPTGAIYPTILLSAFADLAKEKSIALILDETYREFVDGRPHDLFTRPDWRTYLVHLFSFSKYVTATRSNFARSTVELNIVTWSLGVTQFRDIDSERSWRRSSSTRSCRRRSTASRYVPLDPRSAFSPTGRSRARGNGGNRRDSNWRGGKRFSKPRSIKSKAGTSRRVAVTLPM